MVIRNHSRVMKKIIIALAAGDKGGKFEVVSAEDSVLVFTRTLPENKVTVKVELKAPWSYEITAE